MVLSLTLAFSEKIRNVGFGENAPSSLTSVCVCVCVRVCVAS